MPEQSIREQSMGIINSVLTEGLLSARDQHEQGRFPFSSLDHDYRSEIGGMLVIPFTQKFLETSVSHLGKTPIRYDFLQESNYTIELGSFIRLEVVPETVTKTDLAAHLFKRAFYGTNNEIFGDSVLRVLTERTGESQNKLFRQPQEELEKRILHSFLLAVRLCDLTPDQVVASLGSYRSIFDQNPYFEFTSPVETTRFVHGFIPKQILDELGFDPQTTSLPFSVINDSTEADVKGKICRVPNYAGAVKTFLDEINQPLFLHGVRLPTLSA